MSDNYRIAFVPLPDRVTGLLYEPELLGSCLLYTSPSPRDA